MLKSLSIPVLFIAGMVLLWIFFSTRLPPGVEAKGPADWLPWVSLAAAIVSLCTAIITLVLKIAETRQTKV
jgi:purine-cytosine permease-like protein